MINEIRKKYFIGSFINADEIERKLNTTNFIDCNEYLSKRVTQNDWESFKPIITTEDKRVTPEILDSITIFDGVLTTNRSIDSYTASVIAEFFRFILLNVKKRFHLKPLCLMNQKVRF